MLPCVGDECADQKNNYMSLENKREFNINRKLISIGLISIALIISCLGCSSLVGVSIGTNSGEIVTAPGAIGIKRIQPNGVAVVNTVQVYCGVNNKWILGIDEAAMGGSVAMGYSKQVAVPINCR